MHFSINHKFAGYSNIEHSFNTYISKITNFLFTTKYFFGNSIHKKNKERKLARSKDFLLLSPYFAKATKGILHFRSSNVKTFKKMATPYEAR